MPKRAVPLALVGLVVSGLASALAALAAEVVLDELLVSVLIAQAVLWGGLVGTVALASARCGTGRITDDFPLRFQRRDVFAGIGVSLAMRVAAVLAAMLVLIATGLPEDGVADQLEFLAEDRTAMLVFGLAAVLGAPVVEELFFRGLLLEGLRSLLGARLAVPVQALLFGLVHTVPGSTLAQNALLVSALTGAGLVLGVVANTQRRLGAAVWGHAWFNAGSFLIAILST